VSGTETVNGQYIALPRRYLLARLKTRITLVLEWCLTRRRTIDSPAYEHGKKVKMKKRFRTCSLDRQVIRGRRPRMGAPSCGQIRGKSRKRKAPHAQDDRHSGLSHNKLEPPYTGVGVEVVPRETDSCGGYTE